MSVTGIGLDSFEGVGEAALSAMTLLRPGSLGWCNAITAAVYAERNDPSRIVELLSLLVVTEPDIDARVAYIGAQCHFGEILTFAAPEPIVRGHLDRMASSVETLSEAIPASRRYFLLTRGIATVWRYPRPWSAIMDYNQAIRLAQEVADQRLELIARVNAPEMGWLDLGDLDGARRRMLALEERLLQSQEKLTFGFWAINLAAILCAASDERAWDRAEALVAPSLADTSGPLQPLARGSLARVALLRGQMERAEHLAREVMQGFPLIPPIMIPIASVQIHALIGLDRAAEATAVADQVIGALGALGGAGVSEVAARLAVTEAFEANGDHGRVRTELAETLRQIQLRLDDIADPFWKNSYLTRNPTVARALALGRESGLPFGTTSASRGASPRQ
jgi:hypothetical protein